jgi:hypothetical protein
MLFSVSLFFGILCWIWSANFVPRYGWCGNTEGHCAVLAGCQDDFGTCGGSAETSPVGPAPTLVGQTSTDGTCGAGNNG